MTYLPLLNFAVIIAIALFGWWREGERRKHNAKLLRDLRCFAEDFGDMGPRGEELRAAIRQAEQEAA